MIMHDSCMVMDGSWMIMDVVSVAMDGLSMAMHGASMDMHGVSMVMHGLSMAMDDMNIHAFLIIVDVSNVIRRATSHIYICHTIYSYRNANYYRDNSYVTRAFLQLLIV